MFAEYTILGDVPEATVRVSRTYRFRVTNGRSITALAAVDVKFTALAVGEVKEVNVVLSELSSIENVAVPVPAEPE